MEPAIAVLVLLSAGLHPLWNALVKSAPRPEGAYLGLTALLVLIAAAHALVIGADLLAARRVWPLIVASAGGQLLYGVSLVATLRRGDLSAYYPIVRSSPLFIVVVGVLLLGERYSWVLLAGIALVLAGAFLLQYRRGHRLLDDPATLAFALSSMAGTVVYSIVDARIVQAVPPPVLFFWVQALCLPGYLVLFRLLGRPAPARREGRRRIRIQPRHVLTGALCYGSYVLILAAYQLGGNVAAVTSVRQASIPLSVLIGGLYLKERGMLGRLGASLLLAAGIVVIVAAR